MFDARQSYETAAFTPFSKEVLLPPLTVALLQEVVALQKLQ